MSHMDMCSARLYEHHAKTTVLVYGVVQSTKTSFVQDARQKHYQLTGKCQEVRKIYVTQVTERMTVILF